MLLTVPTEDRKEVLTPVVLVTVYNNLAEGVCPGDLKGGSLVRKFSIRQSQSQFGTHLLFLIFCSRVHSDISPREVLGPPGRAG